MIISNAQSSEAILKARQTKSLRISFYGLEEMRGWFLKSVIKIKWYSASQAPFTNIKQLKLGYG